MHLSVNVPRVAPAKNKGGVGTQEENVPVSSVLPSFSEISSLCIQAIQKKPSQCHPVEPLHLVHNSLLEPRSGCFNSSYLMDGPRLQNLRWDSKELNLAVHLYGHVCLGYMRMQTFSPVGKRRTWDIPVGSNVNCQVFSCSAHGRSGCEIWSPESFITHFFSRNFNLIQQ